MMEKYSIYEPKIRNIWYIWNEIINSSERSWWEQLVLSKEAPSSSEEYVWHLKSHVTWTFVADMKRLGDTQAVGLC